MPVIFEPCCPVHDALDAILTLSIAPSSVLSIAESLSDAGDHETAAAWLVALSILVAGP